MKLVIQPHIALLTKHAKQTIIGPILRAGCGVHLIHTDKFDTDNLGTFDNKIARKNTPIECALKKAYLACELTGCDQGIGSEGSVNSLMGLGVVDEEFLAFVDKEHGIEVVASAKQALSVGLIEANNAEQFAAQLSRYTNKAAHKGKQRVDVSGQKWMIKRNGEWVKGLSITQLHDYATSWPLRIEPDFRAMNSPERQLVISAAAHDLVHRLNALCPSCSSPNFVAKRLPREVHYLPCEMCGQPTTKLPAPLAYCEACKYCAQAPSNQASASAFYCQFCNP